LEELKKFNGTDKSLPIYLAIKGTVFDVSKGAYPPPPTHTHTTCTQFLAFFAKKVGNGHDSG